MTTDKLIQKAAELKGWRFTQLMALRRPCATHGEECPITAVANHTLPDALYSPDKFYRAAGELNLDDTESDDQGYDIANAADNAEPFIQVRKDIRQPIRRKLLAAFGLKEVTDRHIITSNELDVVE